MAFLSVNGIGKKISESFSLEEIDFVQQPLHKLAVTGETGSGKSTLLRIIAGLLQPDQGSVWLNDQRVPGPDEQLIPGHASIAYLSQTHELRNNYRIEELLDYANRLPRKDAEALYRIGRIDHLMKRKNVQLSGGEKQRVALTRLLIGAPRLLLLDEPFSNLDPIHKQLLKAVISDIGDRLGITCILTSHDPTDTLPWADEILILKNGRLLQQGSPTHLFHHPVNEYAAGLFGPYNLLDAAAAQLLGIDTADAGQALVRPNGLVIADTGIPVTITAKQFYGNYEYLQALLGTLSLTLIGSGRPVAAGETVFVQLRHYSRL
ncbi:ABC transporter ATP-binding protein [Sediminibacterium soli]|uniref:ABC transporter ATP-binding protein n=1 Tax=Sediminibacterium soli TaxID=2698829 RepID=UPI00137B52F7|nr:ABC transporter ATP-binding protein [Sediminibacterium soli]NCI46449.1 ABC transporter ATP-binding protein [Sediminibacterium soli]